MEAKHDFLIRIAGHTVAVRAGCEATRLFCGDYLCEGTLNFTTEIPAREALTELFRQSTRLRDLRQMGHYMDLLDKLAANVTFYRLCCNMAPDAARMGYTAMAGGAVAQIQGKTFHDEPKMF